MEALSKCIVSQAPKLASAASAALGTTARHHQFSSWSEATPTPRVNRRTELDYEELSTLLLMEDVSLIDVRHPYELHAHGEIPGSVHIPLNDLKNALQLSPEFWIDQFQLNKPTKNDRNLVFYARGPNTSRAAVEIAHRLGFKGSRHYSGGWEDYCQQTGVPLKKTPDITMNSEPCCQSYSQQIPDTMEKDEASYYYGPCNFLV